MIYLDANATEPGHPAARQAALAALEVCGNPSSIHAGGRAARRMLEDAREVVADRSFARARDVVFCSGATEANALAIQALGAGKTILFGATEHDAVRAAAPDGVAIPVRADGTVDPLVLDEFLTAHQPALVCLMAANNETGVLHDIAAAAAVCRRHGTLLHVDAAQAAARARADWLRMGAASMAISGHKAGGPMGAGALILAPGMEIAAAIRGGGQESGRRGGTPSLPAIAGMAAALAAPYNAVAIAAWRDEIELFCTGLGAVVAGRGAARLANTSCLVMPGRRADMQLIALDSAGIAVSAGSACSSGKLAASHVLAAMGFGADAGCAIRVSLPWNVDAAAVASFKTAYQAIMARGLRQDRLGLTEPAIV